MPAFFSLEQPSANLFGASGKFSGNLNREKKERGRKSGRACGRISKSDSGDDGTLPQTREGKISGRCLAAMLNSIMENQKDRTLLRELRSTGLFGRNSVG